METLPRVAPSTPLDANPVAPDPAGRTGVGPHASRLRAVAHLSDGTVCEVAAHDIDTLLAERGTLLWLDIENPSTDEVELLRHEFSFSELALEDTLHRGQRPKVDEYDGYYFIVLYAARCSAGGGLETHEVHCFWGTNYFVSLHEGPIPEIQTAIERWANSGERRRHGVAYQVYHLLDSVIDGYFPVVDVLADRIEELEGRVFEANDGTTLRDIFALRRELIAARRVLGPSRDVLGELIRRDVPVFPRALIPYLADVYDHTIRAIDALDLQRDLLSSVMESYLSVTSNRLNQTMRTLTALTIGLMVPTLIAGIYGMNFETFPELKWEFGYPMALTAMLIAMLGLLALFKRARWL